MKKKLTDAEAKKSARTFPIALAGACVVVLACGFLFARLTTSDRSLLLIISVIVAAAVWSGFYFGFELKKDQVKSRITMFALFVSLVVGTMVGYTLQLNDAEQKFRVKQEADEAAAAAKAAAALKNVAKPTDADAGKKGDIAEFSRFANAYINQTEVLHNQYVHELELTGWNKILDSDRVRQDKGLVESKAILQKAKAVVAKYRPLQLAMQEQALKDIAAMKVSEPSRARIMHAFDSASANSVENINLLWDTADKELTNYEGIFTLLSNKKVNWMAQNGKVLFTEQNDLDVFNNLLTGARDASKKQDEIREMQRDALNVSFDDPKPAEVKPGDPAPADAKPGETKADAPKTDAPKTDAPKADAPKADAPKADTPKK
jgi:hypothetical protein